LRYGPYAIIINVSKEQLFHCAIPEDLRGKTATGLLAGEQAALTSSSIIPPSSSPIFFFSKVSK